MDPESEPAGRLYSAREISELEKERETLHRLSLEVDAEIANETEKIAADGEEEAAPVEREPEPELDVEGNPIEKRAAESEQTDGQKAEAISALLARLVAAFPGAAAAAWLAIVFLVVGFPLGSTVKLLYSRKRWGRMC